MANDFYLAHPDSLKDKPKKTIADYVEQQGILVPRRFDTLREAKESGVQIIARSEHPQEYDGVSGLLSSPSLPISTSDCADDVKTEVMKDSSVAEYCSLRGLKQSEFEKDVSFSLWEEIEGFNHKVIADSAIKGRFHVTTAGDGRYNYTIMEGDRNLLSAGAELPASLTEQMPALIDLYEKIRHFERFDSNHCPLMEFQTGEGQTHFLQYHRTQDFNSATFVLDRPPNVNETQALFVRGCTPPEGIRCRATVCHAACLAYKKTNWALPEEEHASFDYHYNRIYTEIMSRKRKAQFMEENNLSHGFAKRASSHAAISKMFKPLLSLVVPKYTIVSDEEYDQLSKRATATGLDQQIEVAIISDGRKAYVGRV